MTLRHAVLLACVSACSSKPAPPGVPDTRLQFDAREPDAPWPDAFLADAETAPGCDFVQRDHTSLPDNETIPWDLTAPITICGSIDLLHSTVAWEKPFATDTTFAIGSASRQGVKATLVADAPLDVFQGGVSVQGNGVSFVLDGSSRYSLAWLDKGGGGIAVQAKYPTTATAPINYKLTLEPYDFSTLCPQLTTPVEYTESHDGSLSGGNDVFGFNPKQGGNPLVLTSYTGDSPELTGITVASGSAHRVDGVSAAVPQKWDESNDKDTFQLATGPDTTYLVVRSTPFVDPTKTAFVVYNLTTPALDIWEPSGGAHNGPILLQGLGVLPVQPSTTYWLQVEGASLSGGTAGLPLSYDLSICGRNAPP
jgi:hypothetical protein